MKASAISSTITPPSKSASVSPPDRFALTGRSWIYDPRVHAARRDVADVALAGRLFAPHYAQPLVLACAVAVLPLFDRPAGAQTSELLRGEGFAALDIGGGWAWGYCVHDHYVGYVRFDGLGTDHTPADEIPAADDPAAVAETMLGSPYLAGGRSVAGIDCSGLVQAALAPFGIAAPRDSDLQRDTLGIDLPPGAALSRNDLIFFPGHVGLMADADRIIHATGWAGAVVIEPLAGVLARLASAAGPVEMRAKRLML